MCTEKNYYHRAIPRDYELGDVGEYPMVRDHLILEGYAVGIDEHGFARTIQLGDQFIGFCEQTSDNTCGLDGDRFVRVRQCGKVKLPIEDIDHSKIGSLVYIDANHHFTLVSEKNTPIGWIIRMDSPGYAIVSFEFKNR